MISKDGYKKQLIKIVGWTIGLIIVFGISMVLILPYGSKVLPHLTKTVLGSTLLILPIICTIFFFKYFIGVKYSKAKTLKEKAINNILPIITVILGYTLFVAISTFFFITSMENMIPSIETSGRSQDIFLSLITIMCGFIFIIRMLSIHKKIIDREELKIEKAHPFFTTHIDISDFLGSAKEVFVDIVIGTLLIGALGIVVTGKSPDTGAILPMIGGIIQIVPLVLASIVDIVIGVHVAEYD
jgi:hypothetical protein